MAVRIKRSTRLPSFLLRLARLEPEATPGLEKAAS
jgi:hypothetical protein